MKNFKRKVMKLSMCSEKVLKEDKEVLKEYKGFLR